MLILNAIKKDVQHTLNYYKFEINDQQTRDSIKYDINYIIDRAEIPFTCVSVDMDRTDETKVVINIERDE